MAAPPRLRAAHRAGPGREIPGIIPDSKSIHPSTGSERSHAINAAIGQGEVNVTPLQQAVAYAAIANGGTVWTPQIVRRIETPEGKVVPIRAAAGRQQRRAGSWTSSAELATVREGLFAVVNDPGGTRTGRASPTCTSPARPAPRR